MKKTVGSIDKAIRLSAGVALIAVALFIPMSGVLKAVLLIFGAINVLTGLFGVCPLYSLLGISTNKRQA